MININNLISDYRNQEEEKRKRTRRIYRGQKVDNTNYGEVKSGIERLGGYSRLDD